MVVYVNKVHQLTNRIEYVIYNSVLQRSFYFDLLYIKSQSCNIQPISQHFCLKCTEKFYYELVRRSALQDKLVF